MFLLAATVYFGLSSVIVFSKTIDHQPFLVFESIYVMFTNEFSEEISTLIIVFYWKYLSQPPPFSMT